MKNLYLIVLLVLGFTLSSTVQVKAAQTIKYCTHTQWFYGSYSGEACDQINVADFIHNLLKEDLVIGKGENTLTLDRDDVDWIIQSLPGNGPSVELSGNARSSYPIGIQFMDGRLNNTLLSQTITLGLNLRADHNLGNLRLENNKFKTSKATNFSDPLSAATGKNETFYLNQPVLDQLGTSNTVNDLYDLANAALAGEDIGTLELYEVTSAVAVINYAFADGRILKGFYERHKDSKVDFGDQEMFEMRIFPNPMHNRGTIEFTTMESGMTTIELYNLEGQLADVFMNENTDSFMPIRVDFDTQKYKKGMYVIYIRNGSIIHKEKILIVK
jgi:Secretion system C-terminal sorting domain